MAIPIAYNLRNLVVRRTTSIMTAIGIASSVAILVASLALVQGLGTVFANTAHPLQMLVLHQGVTAEIGSRVSTEAFSIVSAYPGIAADRRGRALASQELVNVANLPGTSNPRGMNVTVRGLGSTGIEMRRVRLVQGRWFQPGHREVVVGASVTTRYPSARIGQRIRFGKGDWEVVGVMDGGESVVNSEIWADIRQIAGDYNRFDNSSSVLIRAADAHALEALAHAIEDDRRLNATAVTERTYYESQTASGAPLEMLGILVAIIMAIGSAFATANTMYAAVASRAREIGTLRTLGFSPGHILVSFLAESVLLSAAAGLLGCVVALPLNWVTTGVGSFASFSEITFRFHVGTTALFSGLAFAMVLGTLGGLVPARAAAKKDILAALRET